eukprot:GHVL01017966.1.p2 GENE.GHVL01017966.1~~GHVL01017966.1.p2  ORF type:complete len:400 (-),score=68.17 GHVL01017966.1:3126-4325(-)
MVADEELKLMCAMCPLGGDIRGPFLKEMTQLIHTEYLLEGNADPEADVIDLFRKSMFAPTVTGSPMGNACRVLYSYEKESRSYYSSAIMLLGHDESGKEFLDSAITIRTMEIKEDGSVHLRVGATLVKDSIPSEEVAETESKLKSTILSLGKAKNKPINAMKDIFKDSQEELKALLNERNKSVSKFWLYSHKEKSQIFSRFKLRAILMKNEDDFILMITHLLGRFGIETECYNWDEFEDHWKPDEVDLVVLGPGPGDPRNNTPKMETIKRVAKRIIDEERKCLCVCLGHQCMSLLWGLELIKKDKPLQGVQIEIDLFGKKETVGCYNSFYSKWNENIQIPNLIEYSSSSSSGEVYSIYTKNILTFQFHPESILTMNSVNILQGALERLLPKKQEKNISF